MKDLKNKWVLVTGAASGIGLATAREFARLGANLIVADIDEPGMAEAKKKIEERGVKALTIRADVSDQTQVEALARRALEEAGQVDVLVNNAGIAFISEIRNVTPGMWEKILSINLHAPILLTHHLLPHMIERGSGHVVNIASLAGLIPVPALAPYSTAKFGLVGYSGALRIEMARYGIGVTVVCPGVVRTPILTNSKFIGFSEKMREVPDLVTISPVRAARVIVDGVRKNKARVIPATIGTKMVHALYHFMPGPVSVMGTKFYESWERTEV